MVVTKTRTLSDFARQKNDLITLLAAKTAAAKVTAINKNIDNKFSPDAANVNAVLNAIEAKFKKCEAIYYNYFEDADHGVLSGNITTLPVGVDSTLIDGTAVINYYFSVDDRYAYKDMVDGNFQTFILTIASMYENLVTLAEIFLRKVMVYIKKPLSSPLRDYLDYLKLMISLGYRNNDRLNICMTSADPFFIKYLEQINLLRNKFVHGVSINLESDNYNYYVAAMVNTFTPKSADLLLHVFTKAILDNTGAFIIDLMTALEKSSKHHLKYIPAN
ncbi:hypothetical protein [Mucilaginibacter paludis]|uniref:Cthe-2314-like HEPN domain-containing protein n=1 Tax=Mucilaginibacter paludis DSM 18603 TaxID=714943 RepID=H1YI62_9SPHI|nr:hypothetical protein [Mucilaginibacter paludis]EHQ26497.1 hypothetical protein Mucpa_2367 [Mucilaginibacter paludis DSM 18603]